MFDYKISDNYIEYEDALFFMESRVEAIYKSKEKELLWFLEHPSLYTAGTSADEKDLLCADKFPVYETGRGGQYTYHGPGQRIVYLMLKLSHFNHDIRKFINYIEKSIIASLKKVGISAVVRKDRVGIWVVDKKNKTENKIAAIGIRVRHGISYHGVAINIAPNLKNFNAIVPCGIKKYGVTSLKELGVDIAMKEFDQIMQKEFIKNYY